MSESTAVAFTYQWALSIRAFFSVLGDRDIPQHTIASSFHAHPFFREYSDNFWRQVKYEMHKRTIQENTIDETTNTLSVIHDLLAECFTDIDNAETDHHARDALIFQSAAVYLFNYKNRDILPHPISQAAEITMEGLRGAQKRLLSLLGQWPLVEQELNTIVVREWFAEGWWMGLFPNTISNEAVSVVTSPRQSCGELAIEFYDSSL